MNIICVDDEQIQRDWKGWDGSLKALREQCGSLGMGKGASGAGKFARNIKTEAEFPNSQRNMLYRKRAFSGSCAAQQQTEKIRTEYKNGKTAMEEPPGCLLYFCCFFSVFPCISERCCYNKGK